ncbi:glutamine--tRNA ligase/YqeY domain fusion protein [Lacipirellula sp.]|uniref:glutamine--tRNA ligase/YqeY domain fusion protein n=1 Tax=Lacipirellula sp. TaxID=2691419 RepID=UPI003D0DA662
MSSDAPAGNDKTASRNFIQQIIDADRAAGKNAGRVHTRFPPEPNGYLHIGHAKSICLNFGLAKEFGGKFNLRFDDTNPAKEEQEYVDSIVDDVRWLGGDWDDRMFFASDYFDQLYAWAVQLIEAGKAYVCDLTAEQMREYRGSLTAPGKDSPNRNRTVAENLDLFEQMRAGKFADASRTLRAKIDMASPNINMRDPVLYRIKRAHHHRTGDKWCIYPSYDYTHGQSDSIEGITHSICTLEFENHRPLYDWFCRELGIHHPQQIEFARLNLTYAVMSKRKLLQLVQEKHVNGWDDPRMLTIRGLRRRGYTPEAMRAFCERIGVAKFNSTIDMAWLEDAIREDLNERAPRAMGVLRPLKVVLTNLKEGETIELDAPNHPQKPELGTRKIALTREIFVEQEDFMEDAPKKFFRLKPEGEVRLRCAGIIKCDEVVKDAAGRVTELRCTFDPDHSRKVKGTIHWVSAPNALTAEVRLYDHLFGVENPDNAPEGKTFLDNLNPNSLEVIKDAKLEPSLAEAKPGTSFQFERTGYFYVDPVDSKPGQPVFNRTSTLRDSWTKEAGRD